MGKLTEWLNRNKLQHHPTKARLVYKGSRQNLKTINCDSSIMVKNQPVPRVRSLSCLGENPDESLEWNDHIEMICKKVAAGIGMMKRIKQYIPAYILQTIIYSALI